MGTVTNSPMPRKRILLITAAALALGATRTATGATFTNNNGVGSSLWNLGNNWNPASLPDSTSKEKVSGTFFWILSRWCQHTRKEPDRQRSKKRWQAPFSGPCPGGASTPGKRFLTPLPTETDLRLHLSRCVPATDLFSPEPRWTRNWTRPVMLARVPLCPSRYARATARCWIIRKFTGKRAWPGYRNRRFAQFEAMNLGPVPPMPEYLSARGIPEPAMGVALAVAARRRRRISLPGSVHPATAATAP